MIVSGQKFSLQYKNGSKTRWRCHKHYRGCKAALTMEGNELTRMTSKHNDHGVMKDVKQKKSTNASGEDVKPIKCMKIYTSNTSPSHQYLVANGYRYGLQCTKTSTARWRCTKHGNGCKAAVTLTGDRLKKISFYHNHEVEEEPAKNLILIKSLEP